MQIIDLIHVYFSHTVQFPEKKQDVNVDVISEVPDVTSSMPPAAVCDVSGRGLAKTPRFHPLRYK
jgi:hypothetical protein